MDNKTLNGKAGYVVFSPFTLADSKKILVSRGWIESDQRDSLPELSLPQTNLKLDGMIRPFSKDFVLEDQAKQIANNFIIQGLDKELMEDLSGYKFYLMYLNSLPYRI